MTYDLLTYPHKAGAKEETTSRAAAIAIESSGRAANLRERVKAFFEGGGQGTADEVSVAIGEAYEAVQPRISELRAQGAVEPSGIRRRGHGGRMGHVWRAA